MITSRLDDGETVAIPLHGPAERIVAPFSFAQEQIWLHEQRSGEGAYHFAELFDVALPLDEAALEAALLDVVARNDALRTRYDVVDGIAYNVVTTGAARILECADVRNSGRASSEAYEWCVALGRRRYDFGTGAPFRAGLVRYADDAALFVLAYHHLAYDYTSGGLVLADLSDAYTVRTTPSLEKTERPRYADYAVDERETPAADAFARERRYWQGVFATLPPAVELPGATPHAGETSSSAGDTCCVEIPGPVVGQLRALAASEGASLFTGLLVALRTLVQRYTGLDDFVIGVPVAGRRSARERSTVGCFVNTLPLRTDVSAGATFREALRKTRDAAHAAYDAQAYPHSAIVRDAMLGQARSDAGLIQISATMRDRHRPTLRLGAAHVEALPIELGFATFDCELVASETEHGLRCSFVHRLAHASAASFADAFAALVASAVCEPDRSCATLPLASAAERSKLARRAMGPLGSNEHGTLERAVRARAATAPSAIAIVAGSRLVTYGELVHRADAFARALRLRNVRRNMRIGLCSERSPEAIAAILGIAAAGATYVPLDPALPAARLAAIVEDARPVTTIASETYAGRFPAGTTLGMRPSSDADAGASDMGDGIAEPGDIAYVIYTSGSTGRPKGIEIPHRALANLAQATSRALALTPADRCLYRASLAFDASLSEIAAPLYAGATIVIAPDEESADARALIETAIEQRVSVLGAVPSLLAALLEEPRFAACALRAVTSGGEVLGAATMQRFFETSQAALYNLYGPSEAAGHVAIHRCSKADARGTGEDAPLGRPIANAHVSVRDAALEPVPPGAIGEIVIGGSPLGAGYIGLPAETARRFVADTYAGGELCYRTGDRARLRPDGTLVFLGRSDGQVKIRGVRIEPRDVAVALERLPAIRRAYVVARPRSREAERHDLMLVAYVVAEADARIDAAAVRNELAQLLPKYMLPAATCFVDAFPLTRNGKVDAAELRARVVDAPQDEALQRPGRALASPAEVRIAALWKTLLGRTHVTADDDFFALGGDSLLAMRFLARFERAFGRRVAPSVFFDDPTIAALARSLDVEAADAGDDCDSYHRNGALPPFVFLHGDFGGGRYARRLVAMLGEDLPVTVFGPHAPGVRPVPNDVATMAGDIAERVMKLYPAGALRLGGYSMAGGVALEVARRLEARGRPIDDVIVVATDAGNVRFRALERIARAARLPAAQQRELIRRVRRVVHYVASFATGDAAWRRERLRSASGLARRKQPRRPTSTGIDRQAFERYVGAHDAFVPQPYGGRVLLVWPRDQVLRTSDPRRDWRKLAPQLTIATMPGAHDAAVTTQLETLAGIISERLA